MPRAQERRSSEHWVVISLLSLWSSVMAQGGGLARSSLSYPRAHKLIHCSSPGLPLKSDLFTVLILVFLSQAPETQFLSDLQNGHRCAPVCFLNQPNWLPVFVLPRRRVHRIFFELKILMSLPTRKVIDMMRLPTVGK